MVYLLLSRAEVAKVDIFEALCYIYIIHAENLQMPCSTVVGYVQS